MSVWPRIVVAVAVAIALAGCSEETRPSGPFDTCRDLSTTMLTQAGIDPASKQDTVVTGPLTPSCVYGLKNPAGSVRFDQLSNLTYSSELAREQKIAQGVTVKAARINDRNAYTKSVEGFLSKCDLIMELKQGVEVISVFAGSDQCGIATRIGTAIDPVIGKR
ncbi:uncharacterized protein DUF3558 [Nocardia pseudobrasiliensis]|uniref:Uncharacterized protein DUF3558 n=1 Tax=Nocardia pseudobrasiliensis TaxID=45979 RepID=A0A370I4U6_9NOCA|nr:uncharacterized protein DUF3558 [Nocardia pseudobrasiliensis]